MIVKIIQKQGAAVLVEWQDAVGVHRGVLPAKVVGDGQAVEYGDLMAAMPYGIPWERITLPQVTLEQFAQAFREKGIWTEEDLQRKLPLARQAIQEIYGINLSFLLDAIRRVREGNQQTQK